MLGGRGVTSLQLNATNQQTETGVLIDSPRYRRKFDCIGSLSYFTALPNQGMLGLKLLVILRISSTSPDFIGAAPADFMVQ